MSTPSLLITDIISVQSPGGRTSWKVNCKRTSWAAKERNSKLFLAISNESNDAQINLSLLHIQYGDIYNFPEEVYEKVLEEEIEEVKIIICVMDRTSL